MITAVLTVGVKIFTALLQGIFVMFGGISRFIYLFIYLYIHSLFN